MIITPDEYRAMGFEAKDNAALQRCLNRAEYTIAGLCEGRHRAALAVGGMAEECVKQAAAFQTAKLVKQLEQQQSSSAKSSEKVTIGDYSYSIGEEASTSFNDEDADSCCDLSMQTVRLLRAAGCLCGVREVRE